jgi:hypothetical protein
MRDRAFARIMSAVKLAFSGLADCDAVVGNEGEATFDIPFWRIKISAQGLAGIAAAVMVVGMLLAVRVWSIIN